MFKFKRQKRKKSSPIQETEARGKNISYYAENGGAVPMDFYLPDVVAAFDLEGEIQSFLQKADLDEYNADYMDSIIDARILEGLKDLDRQHSCHMTTIPRLEGNIQSDILVIEEKIKMLEERSETLKKKLMLLGEETI
ncbi:MAG: hypothetical protein Q4D37_01635 [Oscillospiraceae bacterium]|nr:hypothetical protein [Oscillospiraceae bacterium]